MHLERRCVHVWMDVVVVGGARRCGGRPRWQMMEFRQKKSVCGVEVCGERGSGEVGGGG